jgi:hypothetical protein
MTVDECIFFGIVWILASPWHQPDILDFCNFVQNIPIDILRLLFSKIEKLQQILIDDFILGIGLIEMIEMIEIWDFYLDVWEGFSVPGNLIGNVIVNVDSRSFKLNQLLVR